MEKIPDKTYYLTEHDLDDLYDGKTIEILDNDGYWVNLIKEEEEDD